MTKLTWTAYRKQQKERKKKENLLRKRQSAATRGMKALRQFEMDVESKGKYKLRRSRELSKFREKEYLELIKLIDEKKKGQQKDIFLRITINTLDILNKKKYLKKIERSRLMEDMVQKVKPIKIKGYALEELEQVRYNLIKEIYGVKNLPNRIAFKLMKKELEKEINESLKSMESMPVAKGRLKENFQILKKNYLQMKENQLIAWKKELHIGMGDPILSDGSTLS